MIYWNFLMHYGTPRHSGRYAWGSGENPYHHGQSAPWGVRRKIRKYDKLKKTLDKNQNEQDKVNKSLSGYFKSRATIKSAENREKAAKLQKRVDRANRKLSKGKELSWRQQRALEKYEKYNAKADKYDSKTAKQRAELNMLEAREKRIIAKMNKIDDKLLSKHTKFIRDQVLKQQAREDLKRMLGVKTKDIENDSYNRYPWIGKSRELSKDSEENSSGRYPYRYDQLSKKEKKLFDKDLEDIEFVEKFVDRRDELFSKYDISYDTAEKLATYEARTGKELTSKTSMEKAIRDINKKRNSK